MNWAWNGYSYVATDGQSYKLRMKPTNRLNNYFTTHTLHTKPGPSQSRAKSTTTASPSLSQSALALNTQLSTTSITLVSRETSSAPTAISSISQKSTTITEPDPETRDPTDPETKETTASELGPTSEPDGTSVDEIGQDKAQDESETQDAIELQDDDTFLQDTASDVNDSEPQNKEPEVNTTVISLSSIQPAPDTTKQSFEEFGNESLASKEQEPETTDEIYEHSDSDLSTSEYTIAPVPTTIAPPIDAAKLATVNLVSSTAAIPKQDSKEKIWVSVGISLGVTVAVGIVVGLGVIKYLSWRRKRDNLREKREMMAAAMYDAERNASSYGIGEAHHMF